MRIVIVKNCHECPYVRWDPTSDVYCAKLVAMSVPDVVIKCLIKHEIDKNCPLLDPEEDNIIIYKGTSCGITEVKKKTYSIKVVENE